jgi:hypothetical protein
MTQHREDITNDVAMTAPAAEPETHAVPWLAPAWTMLPLAKRRCLVRNPLNGATAELESGEYAVLSACEGCCTLGEHEAAAARRISAPAAHRPAIRALLERCAQRGLLVSLPDLVARFGTPRTDAVSPIAGVAIPTADRPQMVRRLLSGAAALQSRTGTAHRWHVVDDSRSAENRRGNRDAIASRPELDVSYHDLSLADSLESELAAALPELRGEIRWLLGAAGPGEITYARPVSYLLLRFAGHRYLSIDDDVLVEPRQRPLARSQAEAGFARKADYWYESFDAAFAACPELAIDPIAEHERWLGLPTAIAWRQIEREAGNLRTNGLFDLAGPHFDCGAHVVFTENHVLGDPGWHRFSGEQLGISEYTLAWLAVNPGEASKAFASQIYWRGDPSLRLAPQMSLSTTTLSGYDDTVLLPPGVRAGPETDTMIGALTHCIHPAAWMVSLPFALPHVRDGRKEWLTPSDVLTLADSPNRILLEYARMRAASIQAGGPAERLAMVGAFFVDLAAASDTTLAGVVQEQEVSMAARLSFLVNEQLEDSATPESWKQVLRPWLASPVLRMGRESLASTAHLARLRALARDYGRALIAWPRLWTHCRERFR